MDVVFFVILAVLFIIYLYFFYKALGERRRG